MNPRIVLLVPARDEARVIERKLANLARADWPPPADRPHVLCVVDDGSRDGTARLARACLEALPAGIDWFVLANEGAPGKAGALRHALGELAARGEAFDVVVLSDADVVLERPALARLVEAFARDAGLGAACGAQVFVPTLGESPDAPSEPPRTAPELYDRLTSLVRRLESRLGRLFSLHGQLCAWRAGLGLEPPPGIAADDLEVVFRARSRGLAVRLVEDARFHEEKPGGCDLARQTERRAQAYYQLVRSRRRPPGRGWADRLQWAAYRRLPGLAPYALAGLVLLSIATAAARWGARGAVLVAVSWALLASTPAGRALVSRLRAVAKARFTPLESGDRWDTLRARTRASEGA